MGSATYAMASAAAQNFGSTNVLIKSAMDFENELKSKLKWKKPSWVSAGEQGSRMNKLCNSMNFWKEKLKPALEDTSVVLTIFNEERDVKTSVMDIILEIESLCGDFKVCGVSDFRNPRYLCVYFENKEVRDIVREKFRFMNNSFVVYLSWAFAVEDNVTSVKVHWLPMTIDIDIIKEKLYKYVEVLEQERHKLHFLSGRDVPSGKITFKAKLKKNINKVDIPHLLIIENMEALITVAGRQPLCLNCNILGHISRDCKMRYCSVCNDMKLKEHTCDSKDKCLSYARAVKKKDGENDYNDDWNAEILINNDKGLPDKVLILGKISELQHQLSVLDAEELSRVQTRLEKKRKAERLSVDEPSGVEGVSSQSLGAEADVNGDSDLALVDGGEAMVFESAMVGDEVDLVKNESNSGKIRKKKVADGPKDAISSFTSSEVTGVLSGLRSFNKPVPNKSSRKKQEVRSEKDSPTREFVFKD